MVKTKIIMADVYEYPSAIDIIDGLPSGSKKQGPIETKVRKDLERLNNNNKGIQDSLIAMAYSLAADIDSWGAVASAAEKNARTKAHQELRSTLNQIMKQASGSFNMSDESKDMSKAE